MDDQDAEKHKRRLVEIQRELEAMELRLKEAELRARIREAEERMPPPQHRLDLATQARFGCFVSGFGLVGLGIADAFLNPLAFITAPELLASGVGLMIVGATGKKPTDKDQ